MAMMPGGPDLTDREFDRRVAAEDPIVPSSGFSASVMRRVRTEVATPPPIPFPWLRALPGIAAIVFAMLASARSTFVDSRPSMDPSVGDLLSSTATVFGVHHEAVALALTVTAGSLALTVVVVRACTLIVSRRQAFP